MEGGFTASALDNAHQAHQLVHDMKAPFKKPAETGSSAPLIDNRDPIEKAIAEAAQAQLGWTLNRY